jgi:hypothetical protein
MMATKTIVILNDMLMSSGVAKQIPFAESDREEQR